MSLAGFDLAVVAETQPLLGALSRGLMPVVLEELERSQSVLQDWERALARDAGSLSDGALLAAIDSEEQRGRELGFVLALLGERVGAKLLMARREPQGLRWLFTMVEAGLSRRGVELVPSASALPRLAAREHGTYAFTLAAAAIAWNLAQAPRLGWSWQPDSERPALAFDVPIADGAVKSLEHLHRELGLRSSDGRILLDAPASWFEEDA